jgi:predicted MPP superfamily phosphohydrolase
VAQTNYGGLVDYAAAGLLVFQIVWACTYLSRSGAGWPRGARLGAVIALVFLWTVTLAGLCLVLSGIMYYSLVIPVGLGSAIAAAGYLWIVISSLSFGLIAAVRFLFRRIPGEYSPARRNLLRAASVAALAGPSAAFAFGGLIERNRYRVTELDLPVPGLHPDLDGFRIVQVSDLHVSPFLSPRDAGRVIDMANELRADLAVFTGDLITERGDPLDDAIRELIRLRADYGVLGCMGNHEQYVACRDYLERQTGRAGLVFLRGSATRILRGQAVLNVAGVDYQRGGDRSKYLPGVEKLVIPGASNLLLSHNPDVFPVAVRRGFQTVLSGHTHGGQINIEILDHNVNPARFRTPFTSGLYRLGDAGQIPASCFVTNGVGTIGMPIRLGAPPEIALLRLRRA